MHWNNPGTILYSDWERKTKNESVPGFGAGRSLQHAVFERIPPVLNAASCQVGNQTPPREFRPGPPRRTRPENETRSFSCQIMSAFLQIGLKFNVLLHCPRKHMLINYFLLVRMYDLTHPLCLPTVHALQAQSGCSSTCLPLLEPLLLDIRPHNARLRGSRSCRCLRRSLLLR